MASVQCFAEVRRFCPKAVEFIVPIMRYGRTMGIRHVTGWRFYSTIWRDLVNDRRVGGMASRCSAKIDIPTSCNVSLGSRSSADCC